MPERQSSAALRTGDYGTTRETVRSCTSYDEAERAVEYVVRQDFPIERVAVVGRDLRVVEQITGRVGYAQAVLRGASGGAVTALLIGWVFGWFD